MDPQRRLGIYIGFDSPSIIRYLKPLTGDVFKAHFKDCHFNETIFPPLRGEKSLPEARREITWNVSTLSHLNPRTNQCELEVVGAFSGRIGLPPAVTGWAASCDGGP